MATATVYFIDNQFIVDPFTIILPPGQATITWQFDQGVPTNFQFEDRIALSNLNSYLSYSVEPGGREASMNWVNNNSSTGAAVMVDYTLFISDPLAASSQFRLIAQHQSRTVDPEIQNDPEG